MSHDLFVTPTSVHEVYRSGNRSLPKILSIPTFSANGCEVVVVESSERRQRRLQKFPWDGYRLVDIPTSAIFAIERLPLARPRVRKLTCFGSLALSALPVAHKSKTRNIKRR